MSTRVLLPHCKRNCGEKQPSVRVSEGTRTPDRLDHNLFDGGQVRSDLAWLWGIWSTSDKAVSLKLMPQLMPQSEGPRSIGARGEPGRQAVRAAPCCPPSTGSALYLRVLAPAVGSTMWRYGVEPRAIEGSRMRQARPIRLASRDMDCSINSTAEGGDRIRPDPTWSLFGLAPKRPPLRPRSEHGDGGSQVAHGWPHDRVELAPGLGDVLIDIQ
jgi:hypothetical protein